MGSPVGVMPAGQSNNPIISVYPITFFNGKVNIVWRSNLFVQGLFVWAYMYMYMLVNNENLLKSKCEFHGHGKFSLHLECLFIHVHIF